MGEVQDRAMSVDHLLGSLDTAGLEEDRKDKERVVKRLRKLEKGRSEQNAMEEKLKAKDDEIEKLMAKIEAKDAVIKELEEKTHNLCDLETLDHNLNHTVASLERRLRRRS